MSELINFLLARIAEDDVLTEPRRWQVRLRPAAIHLFPNSVLRHMATKHADHPDYREEWKP